MSGGLFGMNTTTFFLDWNLGTRYAATALREQGALVELHGAHFTQQAPDVEWLPVVGSRGWVVVTKDDRLRHNVHEVAAIRAAGVGVFILNNANLPGVEIAAALTAAYLEMVRLAQTQPRPFIASISRRGQVRLLEPV